MSLINCTLIFELRSVLKHAPLTAPPGPAGLTGWSGPFTICERCAARLTARGCGHMLKGFAPVWDEPVTCATCTKGGES